jgi:hypothetical protein
MEGLIMKAWNFKNMRRELCLVMVFVCLGIFVGMISSCGDGGPSGPGSDGELPPELTIELISGDSDQCFVPEAMFTIVLHIRNTSGNSVTYSLPAGIQFIPNSSGAQTMMLLQIYTLTIEPGTTEIICLPVYCLDAALDPPGAEYSYSLGSIVTQPYLREILDLVAGKTIDFIEAFEVQLIIWNSIENGNLSAEDRSYLENL